MDATSTAFDDQFKGKTGKLLDWQFFSFPFAELQHQISSLADGHRSSPILNLRVLSSTAKQEPWHCTAASGYTVWKNAEARPS